MSMDRSEELLDGFVGQITTCAYSEQGCNRMPVRMVAEMPSPIVPTNTPEMDLIMLCRVHARTYVAKNPAFDRTFADDHLAWMEKHDL